MGAEAKRRRFWISATAGTLCFGYGVIRYHVFKGVEWVHLPLYTVNKGVALWAAVEFLLAAQSLRSGAPGVEGESNRATSPKAGHAPLGFLLATIHVFTSLLIFGREYYPKFFTHGSINLTGALAMISGIAGFGVMLLCVLAGRGEHRGIRLNPGGRFSHGIELWVPILATIHVFVMGCAGWINPLTWPGNLPPITLLGFAILSAATVLMLIQNRARSRRK